MNMIASCLKPGGTIGICSPSHIARREDYETILEAIHAMGFRTVEADNLYRSTYGYLAAPEERAADFNQLIRDPEVELVLFGGGEGSNELLPYIDFEAIRQNPKRICSYSDGTTILGAVWALTGLETYYGLAPKMFRNMTDYDRGHFLSHLVRDDAQVHVPSGEWHVQTVGAAEGTLVGGYSRNFAMLLGSQYYPIDLDRRYILFLEDHEQFGGPAYVSAMLSHIEQTGFARCVAGLLFGHYSLDPYPELRARIRRFAEKYGIPSACCDDFGHGVNHAVLPIGHAVRFDTSVPELRYL